MVSFIDLCVSVAGECSQENRMKGPTTGRALTFVATRGSALLLCLEGAAELLNKFRRLDLRSLQG